MKASLLSGSRWMPWVMPLRANRLVLRRQEPIWVDADKLRIVVRHRNDGFKVPTLTWKPPFKRGERWWLAAPHQQQSSADKSRKERSNSDEDSPQGLAPP
jgi:hypothetical protein